MRNSFALAGLKPDRFRRQILLLAPGQFQFLHSDDKEQPIQNHLRRRTRKTIQNRMRLHDCDGETRQQNRW